MPFFPSAAETHSNLMARMRAHAFRPVSAGISFVAPWEAQERVKPVALHLDLLGKDATAHLSEDDPAHKDFCDTLAEFRKDHFDPLLKRIEDGNFDCNGPAIFHDIDFAAEVVEKLSEEYGRFEKPKTEVVKETLPVYAPPPTFKETLKRIDWKKWALGGGAAAGLLWYVTRRTSEAVFPVKEAEAKAKAEEIEKRKMKVGPIVKSETWEVTEDDKTLLKRLFEKATGFGS